MIAKPYVNLNNKCGDSWTPLHQVCSRGLYKVATALLKKNVDIELTYSGSYPIAVMDSYNEEFLEFLDTYLSIAPNKIHQHEIAKIKLYSVECKNILAKYNIY